MGRAVVCPDVARRLNSAQPALTLAPFTLFFAVSLVMSGGHVNSSNCITENLDEIDSLHHLKI